MEHWILAEMERHKPQLTVSALQPFSFYVVNLTDRYK